jgi:hypothetical protein
MRKCLAAKRIEGLCGVGMLEQKFRREPGSELPAISRCAILV